MGGGGGGVVALASFPNGKAGIQVKKEMSSIKKSSRTERGHCVQLMFYKL